MNNGNSLFFEMLEGQQIGQYHLEKLLGVGGFGGVFQASEIVRDQVLRKLAVKVIPGANNKNLLELIAATNLEHDNLIRTYSAGELQISRVEIFYLAMELAEGSLDNRIVQNNLTTEEVWQILLDVTTALDYLHENQQVHRDLKPANILKVKNRWKISDFGLIKQLNNQSVVQTTNLGGTIAYMPPEAFDSTISSGWDIWSLGVLLVEMITGLIPYTYDEPNQLFKRVMNGAVQLPPLPSEFEPIVLGCLQIDRQKRWNTIKILEYLNRKNLIDQYEDNSLLIQKLFQKGDQLCREQKFQEGIEYFDKVINLDSTYVFSYLYRGYALCAVHKYTEAIESFEQALQFEPNFQEAISGREYALIQQKNEYRERIYRLFELLKVNPQDTLSIYNIGLNLLKLEEYEESITYFQSCIEINPELIGAWISLGTAFNELNQYTEEVKSYTKALEIFPNNIDLLFKRGKALLLLKDVKHSIIDFNNLIVIDRNNINAWFWRGIVLTELKDYEEAIKSFDTAIYINPEISYIWYNKGVTLFYQNKYEDSLSSYQKALYLDPNLAIIWEGLGACLTELYLYEDALNAYNQALNLNFNLSYLYAISKIFIKLKKYDESIKYLDEILKHSPKNIDVLIDKIEIYLMINKLELALNNCNLALSIDNQQFYIYYLLGEIFSSLHDFEQAIVCYENSLVIAPDFVYCWYKKGNLFFDTCQYKLAIESYNKVIELCPDFYALDMVLENRKRALYALNGDISVFTTNEDLDVLF